MVIIIEGCDKVGKSTLAKYIEEKYGFRYIKVSQPKKCGPYKEYSDLLVSIKKGENVVFDRFHVGEEVYGPIYRGKSGLTQEQFQGIETSINNHNGILIYCYDRAENIAKRFKENNETFTKEKDIENILNSYKNVLKKSKLIKYKHKMKGKMDLIKTKQIDKIIKKYLFIEK